MFNERLAQFSPDGRWVGYQSDESGRYEVDSPLALFRARIVSGGTSALGTRWQYDVAPDGRFLINVETEEPRLSPITLILNWNPDRQ